MKTIYYLCGLPRSGNTLFGSLLNQNPKIQVTSNSIVCDMLWQIEKLKNIRTFINFPDHSSFDNVSKNIILNYYQNWDYEIIIDRSSWGSPNNLKILEKYSPNKIKFIILVRDVQNIVASFIKWSEENKPNFLDNETDGTTRTKCEYLMRNDLQIVQDYCSAYNIMQSGHSYYLIDYVNLVNDTKNILSGLYDFLEIEHYDHKFTNLKQFSANKNFYDDREVGNNLHHIRTDKIEMNQYEVNKYIPDDLINYYSTLNFWK